MPHKLKEDKASYMKAYHKDHPKKRDRTAYRKTEKARATIKKYCDNPEVKARERAHRIKREFGISIEQYEEMLLAQNGVCAICFKLETRFTNEIRNSLAIDHNHTTGKVRGLLCSRCNRGIGVFDDDVGLLLSSVAYLKRHD